MGKNKKKDKKKNKEYQYLFTNESKEDFYDGDIQEEIYTSRNIDKNESNNIKISKELIGKYKIVCIEGELYFYNEDLGCYKDLSMHTLKVWIMENVLKNSYKCNSMTRVNDIAGLLKIQPDIQIRRKEINSKNSLLINCKNGVFDLEEKCFKDHSSKYYFFNTIDCNYKEDISYKKFKKSRFAEFINEITNGDKELEKLLQQICGYSISNLNNAKRFFIFFGKGNEGKSVLLDLLVSIVGRESVSSIDLQDLCDKNEVIHLKDKTVNISNELPSNMVKDLANIKSLVCDTDMIVGRARYKDSISFYNKAKLLFACNSLPKVTGGNSEKNKAYFNRVIIIPFLNSIPEDRQDKTLIEKLKKEKDIIFRWCLIGLMDFIENNYTFSECAISNKYKKTYVKSESIIDSFIEDRIIFGDDSDIYKVDLVKEFKIYCKEEGRDVESKDIKSLHDILVNKYKVKYKKIHKGTENRYGYKKIRVE